MKILWFAACGLLLLTAGCARHYTMKLSNGTQITTASKPKMRGGSYYYKDATGNEQSVPQSRVREIAPSRRTAVEDNPFRATPER